ncbi:MAG: rRNA maturation RNase YbeY [Anaerolineaceae bacterium]
MIQIIIPPILKLNIQTSILKARVFSTIRIMQLEKQNVTLKLCNDREMLTFNKTYRGIDQTTDVLSFSLDFKEPQSNEQYLGDIIISFPTAKKQAKIHHQSLEDEITFLLIHGLLHLMGYDHENLEEERKMFSLQEKIFQQVLEENK